MSSRKRKISVDLTELLDDALMEQVIRLVGEGSHRGVAGISPRFRKIYQNFFGTCTTSAEEMVKTVSGAEFFCRDANSESRFRIQKDFCLSLDEWVGGRKRYTPLEFVRDTAAKNGRLEVLQWAVAQGCPLNDPGTCVFAASGGHLSILQWLRKNGCPWDTETCTLAAQRGYLALLQWARTNGCPWNTQTCYWAASNGDLNMLQWARANGCPWDTNTCAQAAASGHLNILQWARANGCPWDAFTCINADANQHWDVLRWALANGCPEEIPEDDEDDENSLSSVD